MAARSDHGRERPPGRGPDRARPPGAGVQGRLEAALLEHIGSIVVGGDARGRVTYWNEAAAAAFGHAAGQALGRPAAELVSMSDARTRRAMLARLRAGEVVRAELPVTGRRGTLIVDSVTAPVHDPAGRYRGWIGVAHDVTAQREADARLATAVESAPFGVVLTAADRRTVYVNGTAAKLAGVTPEELVERGWAAVVHPDDRARLAGLAAEARASGRSAQLSGRLLRPDGTVRTFAGEVIPIVTGTGLAGSASVVFELPDPASGGLAEATRGRILDEISNAVIVTGLDGRVRYWNQAAEQRFGWRADEIVGRRTADLGILPEASVAVMTDGLLQHGRWVGPVRHSRSDGTSAEAYVAATLVLDPGGRPESIVTVSADMGPIRDAQAGLDLQSQVVASIDAGMWLVDPGSNRMEFVNTGYERMFGVGLAELQADAWAWLARVHPDDRDRVRRAIEANPIGAEVEYRVGVRGDGDAVWRHVDSRTVAIRDSAGRISRIAGMVTDVSRLRAAETHLTQMATAIEQTRDGVLMVDAEWRVIYVNEAFERLTGRGRDGLIGTRPLQLLGLADEPSSAGLASAALRGETWHGPLRSVRPDGTPLEIELSIWPVAGPDGATSSIVAVLRDRTTDSERLAALDRQVLERTLLSSALSRVDAGGSLDDTAAAVVGPALQLQHVDVAAILAFVNGRLVVPVAAVGPDPMPLQVGRALPRALAGHVREVAALGIDVERWEPVDADDDGRRWAELGLSAVAYLPLVIDGQTAGVLAAGSMHVDGVRLLRGHVPALEEYASVATALLAPHLRQMRTREDGRASLERIIARREFRSVFQPIVELGSGSVVGYEALTRFADGERPDRRFAEAEALGMGEALELATLERAASAAHALPAGAWLSMNVSPAIARRAARLRRVIRRAGRPIVLEITEQTPIDDYRPIRRSVARLGSSVRLAVDDAGAGFASLRHVVELRPDFVKLDLGLVHNVDADPARQALVAGMAHYAAESGCVLVGEGIETEPERRMLRRLGVSLGQGYRLGRPAEAGPAAGAGDPSAPGAGDPSAPGAGDRVSRAAGPAVFGAAGRSSAAGAGRKASIGSCSAARRRAASEPS